MAAYGGTVTETEWIIPPRDDEQHDFICGYYVVTDLVNDVYGVIFRTGPNTYHMYFDCVNRSPEDEMWLRDLMGELMIAAGTNTQEGCTYYETFSDS